MVRTHRNCLLASLANSFARGSVLEKAIDAEAFYPLETGFTCTAFNFALFTIAYLLPLRRLVLALFPPLQTIAELIPSSFGDLTLTNVSAVFIPVALGPALVHSVRWLRHEGSERGETIVEILRLLVYVFVILPFLAWANQGSFLGSSLLVYVVIVAVVLLPGSIGGFGVLLLLEKIGKKQRYIT